MFCGFCDQIFPFCPHQSVKYRLWTACDLISFLTELVSQQRELLPTMTASEKEWELSVLHALLNDTSRAVLLGYSAALFPADSPSIYIDDLQQHDQFIPTTIVPNTYLREDCVDLHSALPNVTQGLEEVRLWGTFLKEVCDTSGHCNRVNCLQSSICTDHLCDDKQSFLRGMSP